MNLKRMIIGAALLLISTAGLRAQDKYFTKTGRIEFSSRASLEDIDAQNKTVAALLDTKTGSLQFSALMKGFEFPKALMQEHFNENYVESDKYPKAEFKGAITNNGEVNYQKEGNYKVKVAGKLTLHGVTRDLQTTATIRVSGGKLECNAAFPVQVSDYNIKIPALVKDKVAKTIQVKVDCLMEPLK